MNEFRALLEQSEGGEPEAASRILPLVYNALRKLAAQKMSREAPGQTLQATALVHEAWLRLGGDPQSQWQNSAHFFAAAAEAMRRILIDNARRKKAQRHGGGLATGGVGRPWTLPPAWTTTSCSLCTRRSTVWRHTMRRKPNW